jgi:hypothetical protein
MSTSSPSISPVLEQKVYPPTYAILNLLITGIAAFLITAFVVGWWYWDMPQYQIPDEETKALVVDEYLFSISGQEKDRLIYTRAILLFPLLALAIYTLLELYLFPSCQWSPDFQQRCDGLAWWIIQSLLFVFIISFWYLNYCSHFGYILPRHEEDVINAMIGYQVGIGLNIFAMMVLYQLYGHKLRIPARVVSVSIAISTVILLGISFLLYLVDLNDLHRYLKVHHINVVYNAIIQVYYGRPLLCGYSHQYGLYPHVIDIILKMLPVAPSVWVVSSVMQCFSVISLGLVAITLYRRVEQKSIACLGFCLFITQFMPSFYSNPIDPYYQYLPIRMLFPCLLMFIMSEPRFYEKWNWIIGSTFLMAGGVLWNADSGIVCYLTWFFALVFHDLIRHRNHTQKILQSILVKIALFCGMFIMSLLLFYIYIFMFYGQRVDFGLFLEYQKIFYVLGFAMLPTQLFHPWWLLAMILAYGLIRSLNALWKGDDSIQSRFIFGLSILSTGLFSYYNGRSHDLVFSTAVWSVIILATVLYADLSSILSFPKFPASCPTSGSNATGPVTPLQRLGYLVQLSTTIGYLTVITALVSTACVRIPCAALKVTQLQFQRPEGDYSQSFREFLAAVREQKLPGVLVASFDRGGFWYNELQQAAPIPLPSYAELVLKSDYEKIDLAIQQGKIQFILVDKISLIYDTPLFKLVNKYPMLGVATMPNQELTLAHINVHAEPIPSDSKTPITDE